MLCLFNFSIIDSVVSFVVPSPLSPRWWYGASVIRIAMRFASGRYVILFVVASSASSAFSFSSPPPHALTVLIQLRKTSTCGVGWNTFSMMSEKSISPSR